MHRGIGMAEDWYGNGIGMTECSIRVAYEWHRRCIGMVVEETGMIGNDMGKAIKNWETQDD